LYHLTIKTTICIWVSIIENNIRLKLAYHFNSILTKGKKDNTYKFALAKFLVDYSYELDESICKYKKRNNNVETIEFSIPAKAFLKYYWNQICKYKIKQNYNLDKLPLIVQIIHNIFGEDYIPDEFESMDKKKIAEAEREITRKCFSEVIPRFQNISHGIRVVSQKVFYEYDNKYLYVKPEAIDFFRNNYSLLSKSIILEWAIFLERINIGLPRLISKIEGHKAQRSSLEKAKRILGNYFHKCFYCNVPLPSEKRMIHASHGLQTLSSIILS